MSDGSFAAGAPQAAEAAPALRRLSVKRNALHLVSGQVVMTALSMIATAVIGRRLGATDFGALYLCITTVTFAFLFVEWGQAGFLIQTIARMPSRVRELVGSAMTVRALMAPIVFAALMLFAWALGYDARVTRLLSLLVPAMLPLSCAMVCSLAFRGSERMDLDALANGTNAALAAVCSILAVLLFPRPEAVVVATGVSGLFSLGFYLRLKRRLGQGAPRVTSEGVRMVLRGGLPFLAFALAIGAQPYIDAVLLSRLASTTAIGWYGAASRFLGTLIIPAGILGSSLYPTLARLHHSDFPAYQRLIRAALRPVIALAVLAGVGTYLFADVAISITFSRSKFSDAIPILQAFALFIALVYPSMTLGYAITSSGRQRALTIAKVASMIVATGLELVLIPYFQRHSGNGGIGAALSLGVAELVMLVSTVALAPRGTFDATIARHCARVVAAGLGAAAVGRAVMIGHPAVIRIPAFIATCVGLAFIFGVVSRDDVRLLRETVKNRR